MKKRINFLGRSLYQNVELFEKAVKLAKFYNQDSIQKMLRILIEERYNQVFIVKNSNDSPSAN